MILEEKYSDIIKVGRTHLQDAVPIKLSQEISGWRYSLERDVELLNSALQPLSELALGGTAVGTGLNAPQDFDVLVAEKISEITNTEFRTSQNKYHALTSKSELVNTHAAIKATACDG